VIQGGTGTLEFPESNDDQIFKKLPDQLEPSQAYTNFSYRAKAKVRVYSFFSRRLPIMKETQMGFYDR